MFIPLHDDNPMRRIRHAYVAGALIAINVLVYAVFQSGYLLPAAGDTASISFGMIPVVLFGKMSLPEQYVQIPEWMTLLTSTFLHGSWMHLAGNMLFLWVFGDNVEDDLGHVRFGIFYLACAALAALAHAFADPASTSPLIGASGAVSGVVAAYVLLHPRAKLWVLILFRIPVKLSAMWVVSAWVIFQAVNALLAAPGDETAWYAHVGGLAAGAVLAVVLKHRDVLLFDRASMPVIDIEPPEPERLEPERPELKPGEAETAFAPRRFMAGRR